MVRVCVGCADKATTVLSLSFLTSLLCHILPPSVLCALQVLTELINCCQNLSSLVSQEYKNYVPVEYTLGFFI